MLKTTIRDFPEIIRNSMHNHAYKRPYCFTDFMFMFTFTLGNKELPSEVLN